ncbi:hypothetical protein FOL47_010287 [Perkinsus chesapeaki]|uniref:Uncharacterized protein n=1 Tax=Perkinsus chesapeaki TaxID=330153 RepID=A0A7J6L4J2_PERCH|nr:hypothetical protein FOL47_010287 [Perkinsus chesapeaki]
MFQLPPHVGALRSLMVEKLWDSLSDRDMMPHMVGHIMEYCGKPVLALDCPREEFLATIYWSLPPFTFTDCGTVYGIYKENSKLVLKSISIKPGSLFRQSAKAVLSISIAHLTSNACYYDKAWRALYVLYNDGENLIKYNMKSGKTEEKLKIPHLSSRNAILKCILVVGDELYIGTEKGYYTGDAWRVTIDVFHLRLTRPTEVRPVFRIGESPSGRRCELDSLRAVSGSSRAMNIRYKADEVWHIVDVKMVKSGIPTLFAYQTREIPELMEGSLVRGTLGLDMQLVEANGSYILRDAATSRTLARIYSYGEGLSEPVIFDRWSISCLRRDILQSCILERYHLYLN